MNCPDCGREVPASLERCTACGAILTSGASTGAFPAFSDDAGATQVSSAVTGSFPSVATGAFSSAVTGAVPPSTVFDSKTGDGRPPSVSSTRSPGTDENSIEGTGPLEPGQSFGSRYHIIRLLGIGGMGAVYQAWDSELGVAVAIKVVLPGTGDPEAAAEVERRFKNELLLARQVTHKNVVRIHDLGEINGIKYITMSYVEGSDLATILKKEGRLPIGRTLAMMRAVASGLAAAHAEGVVHRDLKPANIMIEGHDEALIMDFGIARSTGRGVVEKLSARNAPAGSVSAQARFNRTVVGTVVGTLEYMAPEQAKGQAVDQRADIYSFGLIVYDMLVGRSRAEKSTSAIAELQARMQQSPPALKTIVPEVPEPLNALVMQCLEPDRDKRFATTADLVAALAKLDDKGKVIPIARRLTQRGVAVAAVVVIAMLAGTYFVTRRAIEPVKEHEPVLVLIADLENSTNDPAFDHALEPTLKRALEGASFISAYDRTALSGSLGVRPPEKLNETAAREIGVKQGIGVVVSGTLDRQGNGYGITIKASESITGKVIANARGRASGKDQVLDATTRLVTDVRTALGDETSEDAQRFAMVTLSATSLEVVRYHAAALDAVSNGKYEQALENYKKAVELDPKFGVGYQGMAVAARNLGRLQDADNYSNEALRHLDSMTERERLGTRGLSYRLAGDYQQCVKEYGELLARYSADVTGLNQVALCQSYLRNWPKALEEVRRAVSILPSRVLYRTNLALYESYAGNFQNGEKEALAIKEPGATSVLALAFAQLGQGRLPDATATYEKLATIDARGGSRAASGLADLALYEGRFSDAVRILEQGVTVDLSAKSPDRAATKLAALAYVRLLQRNNAAAIAAAERALENSGAVKIRFLAARIFVETGRIDKAKELAEGLAKQLPAEPQTYSKIIQANLLMKEKDWAGATRALTDANTILDTWIGHFDLGRAFLESGQFPQADGEFDRCIRRRGETLALFLDEDPTYGFLPAAYLYQGRVREAMKSEGFAEAYGEYVKIRGNSTEDPLLPDVRKRSAK